MDKVKKFLVIAKKYHFWIICGVMLLTVIVCWWLATAGLDSQFRQRKTKLEGDFKNVIITQNHPNERVIENIQEQHKQLKSGVFTAWEELYNEQKVKNPFPKVLGEDFKQQFENLKPKSELKAEYRERYQNFIKLHLPNLLKMIDVRRPPEEKEEEADGNARPAAGRAAGADAVGGRRDRAGARGPGLGAGGPMMGGVAAGGTAANEEWIGTVDWNSADYSALEQRFDWRERPSTLAVVLAQEDLWVIEALLRIIKDTNKDATTYATASVKRIEALQIGRDTAGAWKDSEEPIFHAGGAAGGAGGMGGMGMGGMGMPGAGAPGMGGMRAGMDMGGMGGAGQGAAGSGDEQTRRLLIEGRYVDDKGKPLPYDIEFPYTKHPYAEFKMMPIRMNLVMDQRRLPELLVECANSNMPIQVRRVRIMKTQGGSLDLGATAAPAAGAGRGGAGPARGMPMAAPARAGAGMGMARPAGDTKGDEGSPYDIPVEIQGVIYIYNPPDIERLGTGTASAEKLVDGAAPVDLAKPAPAPVAPAGKAAASDKDKAPVAPPKP